jgi:hypothetical protein
MERWMNLNPIERGTGTVRWPGILLGRGYFSPLSKALNSVQAIAMCMRGAAQEKTTPQTLDFAIGERRLFEKERQARGTSRFAGELAAKADPR